MELSEHGTDSGSIAVTQDGERIVVALAGEVDAELRPQASASMAAALTGGLPIVVDTSRATFVDSSGIAFVLQLQLAASEAGIPLTLHDPSRVLTDVLDMIGMQGQLPPESTLVG